MNPESFFKQVSDVTRLRILMLLQPRGELCVCEFTHALELSQPKISRHLATLREAGVVIARRSGKWMYYSINNDLPGWIKTIIREAQVGVSDKKIFNSDKQRLDQMPRQSGTDFCDR